MVDLPLHHRDVRLIGLEGIINILNGIGENVDMHMGV